MAQEQIRQFIDQATQSIQGGQFEGALRLIDQALEIEPKDADALILRGICLSQTGQPVAATEAFQQAITSDPTSAKARYNLAVHQYAQGQKREALQSAREAADRDATHAAARQLISTIEAELNLNPMSGPNPNDPLSMPPVAPPIENSPANPYTTASVPPVETPSQPTMPGPPTTVGPAPGAPSPAQNPYYKFPGAEPAHSLPFIETMGGVWTGIGWFLVIFDLAMFAAALAIFFPIMSEAMAGSGNPAQLQARIEAMPAATVLQIGGWASKLLIIGYSILDIIDRRGNFIWLIPNVICTCCSFGWLTMPIYMLAGRNK